MAILLFVRCLIDLSIRVLGLWIDRYIMIVELHQTLLFKGVHMGNPKIQERRSLHEVLLNANGILTMDELMYRGYEEG